MPFDYLAGLNREQRRAVEYGVKPGSVNHAGPLLVIAGAGTGKTKTLAHRVGVGIRSGVGATFHDGGTVKPEFSYLEEFA